MTLDKRKCFHCEKIFTPANNTQLFCSEKCRSKLGYTKYKIKKKIAEEEKNSKKDIFRIEDYGDNILI